MAAGAIAEVNRINSSTVEVITNPCLECGATHEFILDMDRFFAWQAGEFIQNAFPDMSVADREILISGTCSDCFDKMFPPSED